MLINISKNLLKANLVKEIAKPTVRPLWEWLNHVWNQFDSKRVEEVGPNRACAEWLLKCGAQVKFKNWGNYTNDYNNLPPGGFEAYLIEEIKAEDACIMAPGFEYLKGLKNVKKVAFVGCSLVDDAALGKLAYIRTSVQDLRIVYCDLVTDYGLSYLYLLKELKMLHLNYLPNVKQPELCLKLLKEKLPNCNVTFSQDPDLDPETKERFKKKSKFSIFG